MANPRRPRNSPVFIDDCEIIEPQEPLKDKPKPEPLKKVRVLEPFQVFHDGTAYWPNVVATVPESVADSWIANRWVTEK
jgi:hypothetical protein